MAVGKKDKTPGTDLAAARATSLAAVAYDAEDVGAGFEDMGAEDMAIPFLRILQKGSPEVDEDNDQHIEGAKAGMIINTVTRELYDGRGAGIPFIPVHRHHSFIEWIPRDSGGGFVGQFDPQDPMVLRAKKGGAFGKLESPEGNDLVETFSVFGLHVDGEDLTGAIIAFSSTGIKHYKRWMTQARAIMVRSPDGRRVNPPMFAHRYRLKTKLESKQDNTWFGWSITFDGDNAESARLAPESELFMAAKGFRELVTSGVAKPAYNSAQGDEGEGSGEEGGGKVF